MDPPVILLTGGLDDGSESAPLATELAEHFTNHSTAQRSAPAPELRAFGSLEGVCMQVTICEERPEDVAAVGQVNETAFGQPTEAGLITLLRANGGVLLSLVAVVDGNIVGHILYTPVRIDADAKKVWGAGLGPMAVLPEFQRKGIGSKLVAEGINRLRQSGCPFIVVLGHPNYYPRFGFVPASRYGVRCQWAVPDEAFMVLPLTSKRSIITGLATYRDEFFFERPRQT